MDALNVPQWYIDRGLDKWAAIALSNRQAQMRAEIQKLREQLKLCAIRVNDDQTRRMS
jgi:hypothetical protein